MITLSIPDMTCGHCKASVTQALAALPGTAAVEVDLPAKTVRIDGTADPAAMVRALDAIGFPAQVIAA
jgi:copper chaperone